MRYTKPGLRYLTEGNTRGDCNSGSSASSGGHGIECNSGFSAEYAFGGTACWGGNTADYNTYPCAYGNGDTGEYGAACLTGPDATETANPSSACFGGSGVI